MNTSNANKVSQTDIHLLDRINDICANVGDGLNDDELTRLLCRSALPAEAGFSFLSFSSGVVTLSVPRQDLTGWYPKKGWIVAGKEKIARAIAEKHGLSFCEPPDQRSYAATAHHHLELTDGWQAVVVAHPIYLKVRLFGPAPDSRRSLDCRRPLPSAPDLLQDLAALYRE